jgi:hypothetical protein
MVSGLLAVDLVILLTWQLQDPLARRLETFPLEDPLSVTDDIKIRPELEHCESHNNSIWLGNKFSICYGKTCEKTVACDLFAGGCELWPFYENEKGEKILLSLGCK